MAVGQDYHAVVADIPDADRRQLPEPLLPGRMTAAELGGDVVPLGGGAGSLLTL